jgi:hypothetical protein
MTRDMHGRFATEHDGTAPLFAYARRTKRASNVKGEATKRTRHRAKVMLVCAMLRAEAAARVVWF